MFRMVRKLSGLGVVKPDEVETALEKWLTIATDKCGFKIGRSVDELRIMYAEGQSRMKYAEGAGPADQAFRRASAQPVPAEGLRYTDERIQLLVAWCRELQIMHGDKPFPMSYRVLASRFKIDKDRAGLWLRLLVMDGILKLELKGGQRSESSPEMKSKRIRAGYGQASRLASEYRYVHLDNIPF